MAGPEGLAVQGTLDWLFPSASVPELEVQRPLGVAPDADHALGGKLVKKSTRSEEPWNWINGRGGFSGNADLLLDPELLVNFKAVALVKRTATIPHSPHLFETLSDRDVMNSLGFSVHCVPSTAQEQVLVPRGNTLTLGHVVPKSWLLTVYYQAHRRAEVEPALKSLKQMSGCEFSTQEMPADAEPMDQLLMHRHGCQRYGLWVRQGQDDIEVSNGKALDAEMSAWQRSYEAANFPAIAGR